MLKEVNPDEQKKMLEYIEQVGKRAIKTTYLLMKVMLPAMILIKIATDLGIIEKIGFIFKPIVKIIGIPEETGLIIAISLFTNLYGGIGALLSILPTIEISVAQLSVLCSIMLFAHSIPTEQAIVRAAGSSFLLTAFIRILVAFVYGAIVSVTCEYFGLLQQPAEMNWIPQDIVSESWGAWTFSTAKIVAGMLSVILTLYILLDLLKKIGVIDLITNFLSPALNAIGLNTKLAPLTTIGLLLGLTYGGGLIIEEASKSKYSKTDLFLTLTCLSLLHFAYRRHRHHDGIGANVWIVLVARVMFAICLIAFLAWFLKRFARAKTLQPDNSP